MSIAAAFAKPDARMLRLNYRTFKDVAGTWALGMDVSSDSPGQVLGEEDMFRVIMVWGWEEVFFSMTLNNVKTLKKPCQHKDLSSLMWLELCLWIIFTSVLNTCKSVRDQLGVGWWIQLLHVEFLPLVSDLGLAANKNGEGKKEVCGHFSLELEISSDKTPCLCHLLFLLISWYCHFHENSHTVTGSCS